MTPGNATQSATRGPAITAGAIFVGIVGLYIVLAFFWPMAYLHATYENLYGEWAQVFLFATAGILSTRLAIRPGHRHRLVFGVLAMAAPAPAQVFRYPEDTRPTSLLPFWSIIKTGSPMLKSAR